MFQRPSTAAKQGKGREKIMWRVFGMLKILTPYQSFIIYLVFLYAAWINGIALVTLIQPTKASILIWDPIAKFYNIPGISWCCLNKRNSEFVSFKNINVNLRSLCYARIIKTVFQLEKGLLLLYLQVMRSSWLLAGIAAAAAASPLLDAASPAQPADPATHDLLTCWSDCEGK